MRSTISGRLIQRRGARLLLGLSLILFHPLAAAAEGTGEGVPVVGQGSSVRPPFQLAQADDQEPPRRGKLEPRYQPREPEPKSWYNSGYVFGLTRGVADSTIHSAVKAPFFVLTLPLDLVLMPFALIGGMFG